LRKTKKEPSLIIRFFSAIVLPRFQIISLVIVAFAITIITYNSYYEYNALEPDVPLTLVTPQQIQQWGILPTQVNVGLHITGFPSIDFKTNEFVFEGIIWFEFDPALISLNTVAKFSFEHGTIVSISEPYTQIVENKFFARYTIRVKFKADLDYRQFPFDDHRLDIILVNRHIQPSEMIYHVHSLLFKISENAVSNFSGWKIYDKHVNSGWTKSVLEQYPVKKIVEYPVAIFSFGIIRSGLRNILLILLPLFLVYFLTLFSYSFDPTTHAGTIFGIASSGVGSLIGYRFVIEGMSPKVGYFLFSDAIFMLFFTIIIFNFIYSVILLRTKALTKPIIITRGIIYLSINISLIILWYYLINQYMPSASL